MQVHKNISVKNYSSLPLGTLKAQHLRRADYCQRAKEKKHEKQHQQASLHHHDIEPCV